MRLKSDFYMFPAKFLIHSCELGKPVHYGVKKKKYVKTLAAKVRIHTVHRQGVQVRVMDAPPNWKNHDPFPEENVFLMTCEIEALAYENASHLYPEAAHNPTDGGRYVSHILENG